MDHAPPTRIAEKTAAAVCDRARPGEDALALLTEGMTPRQYLDALSGAGLHAEAVGFLAHALPRREAVWWACICVAEAIGPGSPPPSAAALEAARAWALEPTDENRRAALPAAETAGLDTAAGCVAQSVFFSGGSLTPPKLPEVAPPAHLTAHLVACALNLAAVRTEPEKAPEKLAAFLKAGLEVAEGRIPWEDTPPGPTTAGAKPAPAMTERERKLAELQARRARR